MQRLRATALALGVAVIGCDVPEDLCTPQDARLGFFSKGDCILTRSSAFQGHEWLTYFANEQLTVEDRFSSDDVEFIADGNRRVDWPLELLVHLDNGVVAYVRAVVEYTERNEVQPFHFLLDDKNSETEAADAARRHIATVTNEALRLWVDDPVRALTLLGKAQHTIQDSFSPAHTQRDVDFDDYGSFECTGACACIERVKAFKPRAPGYEDVLFHGSAEGSTDNIGHTTSLDSIYRPGRDCHSPDGEEEVKACLDQHAWQAIRASAQYLRMVQRLVGDDVIGIDLDEGAVDSALTEYVAQYLSLRNEL